MATHDYIVDNQNGANFRSDLNNALAAIVSNNSSATAPTTTYAFMLWADTANDLLKQRNAADSAWISILTLSTGAPLGTLSSSLLSGALPAIDGSALTSLTSSQMPSGSILQVVQASESNEYGTNSSSWAQKMSLNLSITPSSSSNKILLMSTVELELQYANSRGVVDFYRSISGGATTYNLTSESQGFGVVTDIGRVPVGVTYLDSPATTSAITYDISYKWLSGGTGNVYAGGAGNRTTIIAMEVKA